MAQGLKIDGVKYGETRAILVDFLLSQKIWHTHCCNFPKVKGAVAISASALWCPLIHKLNRLNFDTFQMTISYWCICEVANTAWKKLNKSLICGTQLEHIVQICLMTGVSRILSWKNLSVPGIWFHDTFTWKLHLASFKYLLAIWKNDF